MIEAWTVLFADASRDVDTGAGGWGAWARRDGGRPVEWSGPFHAPAPNISVAEMWAIANALHAARTAGVLGRGGGVLIQSDSLCALSHIRRWVGANDRPIEGGLATHGVRGDPHPAVAEAMAKIAEICASMSLRAAVRHVKGHGQGDGRAWANGRCDGLARAGMELARGRMRCAATGG